jgi:hypothetical protein
MSEIKISRIPSHWLVCLVAAWIALASGIVGAADSSHPIAIGPHAEGAFVPHTPDARSSAQRRLPSSRQPAQVALARLSSAQLDAESRVQSSGPGVRLRIGFGREVPVLRDRATTSALLDWAPMTGAQIAAISITAAGAAGLRLGLLVDSIPDAVVLRFYSQHADRVFEVSGREIAQTISANRAAGDIGEEGRTYWSPAIDGEEVTLEVELPAGISTGELRFSIPRVSHLFASPVDTRVLLEKSGNAGSCNLDSTCYAAWSNESLSVARMSFVSGGHTYLCTGTLLNDQDPSTFIPYFLSAEHCISTQTEASSLQTYWFYRASSCNSGSLSPAMQTLTGGATLLYASSVTDTSFMRLNGAVPGGTWMAAWTATQVVANTPQTGLHNPGGSLQKISFGTIIGISGPDEPGTSHIEVDWNQGVTEPGSSGSAIWVTSGGSHYLVGQLTGGYSSCSNPTAPDWYGRFDLAYNAALYQWLGAQVTNYTVTVTAGGTGQGTVTGAGINCTIAAGSASGICSASVGSTTGVTLLVSPAGGSSFMGWLGACTDRGTCHVEGTPSVNVSATFAPANVLPRIDIDGNSRYDALTDGLMILRYLFDLRGESLTSGALGIGASRVTPEDILSFLNNVRPLLDADGNGQADALTDGIILIRYMFGLQGAALTNSAIGPNATRGAGQIETYIESVTPTP